MTWVEKQRPARHREVWQDLWPSISSICDTFVANKQPKHSNKGRRIKRDISNGGHWPLGNVHHKAVKPAWSISDKVNCLKKLKLLTDIQILDNFEN